MFIIRCCFSLYCSNGLYLFSLTRTRMLVVKCSYVVLLCWFNKMLISILEIVCVLLLPFDWLILTGEKSYSLENVHKHILSIIQQYHFHIA